MLLRELGRVMEGRPPLQLADVADPIAAEGQVLIRVSACAVCHTELDEIEGRTPPPHLPVVPGHQVIGRVVEGHLAGQRVGVAWIYSACGKCAFCTSGRENLCDEFRATGRDINGGYAQTMLARAEFVHPIPAALTDSQAAPLLCAGAVGYRALRLTNLHDGETLGLFGFGASNHLVLKTAQHSWPRSRIMVFTRNAEERQLALNLGAAWAGGILDTPPQMLGAAIDATPAWKPVVQALAHLVPGGRLVINAIRKEDGDKADLLQMDYAAHLWREKEVKSVANVTREDVRQFIQIAAEARIVPEYEEFALEDANRALLEIKQGRIRGAKVLRIM